MLVIKLICLRQTECREEGGGGDKSMMSSPVSTAKRPRLSRDENQHEQHNELSRAGDALLTRLNLELLDNDADSRDSGIASSFPITNTSISDDRSGGCHSVAADWDTELDDTDAAASISSLSFQSLINSSSSSRRRLLFSNDSPPSVDHTSLRRTATTLFTDKTNLQTNKKFEIFESIVGFFFNFDFLKQLKELRVFFFIGGEKRMEEWSGRIIVAIDHVNSSRSDHAIARDRVRELGDRSTSRWRSFASSLVAHSGGTHDQTSRPELHLVRNSQLVVEWQV